MGQRSTPVFLAPCLEHTQVLKHTHSDACMHAHFCLAAIGDISAGAGSKP